MEVIGDWAREVVGVLRVQAWWRRSKRGVAGENGQMGRQLLWAILLGQKGERLGRCACLGASWSTRQTCIKHVNIFLGGLPLWQETEGDLEEAGRADRQGKSDTEWRRKDERVEWKYSRMSKESSTKPSVLEPVGQQRSSVSTKKETGLVSLPNSVTGGEQCTRSNASVQRQDRFQISAAGAFDQEHSLQLDIYKHILKAVRKGY